MYKLLDSPFKIRIIDILIHVETKLKQTKSLLLFFNLLLILIMFLNYERVSIAAAKSQFMAKVQCSNQQKIVDGGQNS